MLAKKFIQGWPYDPNELFGQSCVCVCVCVYTLYSILVYIYIGVSLVALVIKNLTASAGDVGVVGSFPGSRRSLGKGMATHSSILVRILGEFHGHAKGAWWTIFEIKKSQALSQVLCIYYSI